MVQDCDTFGPIRIALFIQKNNKQIAVIRKFNWMYHVYIILPRSMT